MQWLWAFFNVFFSKASVQVLPILIGSFVFYDWIVAFIFLDKSPLSDVCIENVFSKSVVYLFIILTLSCKRQKF